MYEAKQHKCAKATHLNMAQETVTKAAIDEGGGKPWALRCEGSPCQAQRHARWRCRSALIFLLIQARRSKSWEANSSKLAVCGLLGKAAKALMARRASL